MARISNVSDSDFDDLVIGAALPTVVIFWPSSSVEHVHLYQQCEEFAERLSGRVNFFNLRITDGLRTVTRLNIGWEVEAILFRGGTMKKKAAGDDEVKDFLVELEEGFGKKDE